MSHPGYIVDFGDQDRVQVLTWLMTYLMDDTWQMSPNNTSCVRYDHTGHKSYRWRMSLRKRDNRVLFGNPEDVQLFVLAWPAQVIDLSQRSN